MIPVALPATTVVPINATTRSTLLEMPGINEFEAAAATASPSTPVDFAAKRGSLLDAIGMVNVHSCWF